MLNITCAIIISLFAIWTIADARITSKNTTKETVILIVNISSFAWISISAFFVCFSLILSKREKLLKKKRVLVLIFILPVILLYKQWTVGLTSSPIPEEFGWYSAMKETFWTLLFYVYYVSYMLISIYIIYRHGIQTKKTSEKKQSEIIVATVSISLIGVTITDVILPALDIYVMPLLGKVNFLFFGGGIVYAILKYEFLTVSLAFAAENIISTMEELLILTDHEGNIIHVNNAVIDSLKYEQKELSGKAVAILFRENSFTIPLLERITRGEKIKNDEAYLLRKDANVIPVIFSCSTLKDKEGDISGIVFIASDITERKRAEETLLENEAKYRTLVTQSPDGIFIVDLSGAFLSVNKTMCESLKYSEEEFLAMKLWDIIPLEYMAMHKNRLADILKGKRENEAAEYEVKGKDGITYSIEVLSAPYYKDKVIIGFQGIARDITRRKHAEKELIEAKNKAEESDRLKSTFLANMSHEVRTPLNSIIGFSELLADPDFEQELKDEFIQHIIRSGNNLLTIISDIMDLSKLESGEITIRKSRMNAQKFITDLKEQFAFQTEAKKLELKLSLPDTDEETIVFTDVDRLSQIFNNLISNALKFTEYGSIEIGYQPKGKVVEFYVKDTGIGIPAEFHDKIFERFRQVEDAKTRAYGGNGLGLAITKNLVELMGGKTWVVSESGVGSVFYFTLPIHNCEVLS